MNEICKKQMSKSDVSEAELLPVKSSWFSTSWLSWNKYTSGMLRAAEKKILQYCRTAYRGWFVDIGPVVGTSDKIWTISMNTDSTKTPLVLLHGLGAGVALWCLNLDSLASHRPVYAIDILGFGRSSRPSFNSDGLIAETELVKSIEEWRKEMKLEKFILLGHSMGGFLAASYAMSFPGHVNHLILADPWGFPEKPPDSKLKEIPLWVRAVFVPLQPLNPLWAVRVAGPFGQWLINRVRPDITKKFSTFVKDDNLIAEYIYQCNAQTPSGESAFHSMMYGFAWAKHPMVNRIHKLDEDVPITLLYGLRSWIDNSAGEIIKEKRIGSEVNLIGIPGAGHHVYADKPEVFNKHINDICFLADKTPTNFINVRSKEQEQIAENTDEQPDKPNSETSDVEHVSVPKV